MKSIDSSSTIKLNVVKAEPSVFVDQYKSSKIDVADLKGIASKSVKMGAALLTHVLTEYRVAAGMQGGHVMSNFGAAHTKAITAESGVFGAARRTISAGARFPNAGGTITFEYRGSNDNVLTSFTYTLDENRTPK
ncbi:MAG TPA: hypothetical protein VFG67_10325 [Oleiagrimonas sp.]|nr:hypothetical protein [Oleiagrimonas sp.]